MSTDTGDRDFTDIIMFVYSDILYRQKSNHWSDVHGYTRSFCFPCGPANFARFNNLYKVMLFFTQTQVLTPLFV